jgi:exodeoxyribonuclease III
VRVATFNINNINKRLDNLLAWLAKAEPDVVSLQELKAEQESCAGAPCSRRHLG